MNKNIGKTRRSYESRASVAVNLLVLLFILVSLIITFIIVDTFLIEPDWLKVKTIKLSSNPRLRIVHFTDLHHIKGSSMFQKAVNKINSLKPDLVCFTGDVVGGSNENTNDHLEAFELFAKIKAPVFGVPGNHDYWAKIDFNTVDHVLQSGGGKWLVDSSFVTGDGRAKILGVSQFGKFIPEPESNKINILLCHYPAIVDSLQEKKFDLILAGHTHGGQVRIPFKGALIIPYNSSKYDYGLFMTKNGPLYVGSGIGYFYIKARFNCRPEIVLFEL